MSLRHTICPLFPAAILIPVLTSSLSAQEENTKIEKAMQARMAKVQAKFVDANRGDAELELHQTPLLSFSDPTRQEIGGKLWLWHSDASPVALFGLTYYGTKWSYEHVTLVDDPLEFSGGGDWKWAPKPKKREWFRLDAAVSEKTGVRKTQMRAILREFRASELYRGDTELRLLPRPLYLYSSGDSSLLEGGLFAFSHGTNPELIVLIEARRNESGESAWHVSFAQLTAAELKVYHQGELLCKIPDIKQWDPRREYYSHEPPITEPELRIDNK